MKKILVITFLGLTTLSRALSPIDGDPTPTSGSCDVILTFTATLCTACTGTATATPSGISPYTYLWSPGGQTTMTATGLCIGTYSVIITDFQGCVVGLSILVTSNGPVTLSVNSTSTGCTTSVGTATISPSGGALPYTYMFKSRLENL